MNYLTSKRKHLKSKKQKKIKTQRKTKPKMYGNGDKNKSLDSLPTELLEKILKKTIQKTILNQEDTNLLRLLINVKNKKFKNIVMGIREKMSPRELFMFDITSRIELDELSNKDTVKFEQFINNLYHIENQLKDSEENIKLAYNDILRKVYELENKEQRISTLLRYSGLILNSYEANKSESESESESEFEFKSIKGFYDLWQLVPLKDDEKINQAFEDLNFYSSDDGDFVNLLKNSSVYLKNTQVYSNFDVWHFCQDY
jgi:hypothetical protein